MRTRTVVTILTALAMALLVLNFALTGLIIGATFFGEGPSSGEIAARWLFITAAIVTIGHYVTLFRMQPKLSSFRISNVIYAVLMVGLFFAGSMAGREGGESVWRLIASMGIGLPLWLNIFIVGLFFTLLSTRRINRANR